MVFRLENLLAADPSWRYKLLGVCFVIVLLITGAVPHGQRRRKE